MVFWVFGYGSLVWNPGFDYDERVIGFIRDYRRVFDLACIDHRGTPEHPARICTLEYVEGSICWGAAYCVRGGPEKERLAMEYLERRECEYDQKTIVDFYKEGEPLQPALKGAIVFTSMPDKVSNKYYLGPAPLEDMARQIATAFGPCGNNRDYLFWLEKAMFDIGEIYFLVKKEDIWEQFAPMLEINLFGRHEVCGDVTGHEDDMVIELANEVRKVLGIVGKKMFPGSLHISIKSHLPTLELPRFPEAVAMDS